MLWALAWATDPGGLGGPQGPPQHTGGPLSRLAEVEWAAQGKGGLWGPAHHPVPFEEQLKVQLGPGLQPGVLRVRGLVFLF